MIRLKSIIVCWICLSCALGAFAQKQSYFAVGLVSGANSTIITYAIVTKVGDRFIGTQLLTEQFFMYYALGYWPCKANPDRGRFIQKI